MINANSPEAHDWIIGLFNFLETEISCAVIHGYEDGFQGEVSDVDMVIPRHSFSKFIRLVSQYCESEQWCMAQILQHEISAWYLVCCDRTTPSQFVALDVCSDYLVRGHLVLSADELLDKRVKARWGGWQSNDSAKLSYCVAKAAAKKKPTDSILTRNALLESSGDEVKKWLENRWNLKFESWDSEELTKVLDDLRIRLKGQRWSIGELVRIFRRCLHPSGFHWAGDESHLGVFKGLFRHEYQSSEATASGFLKGLLGSTLWIGGEPQTIASFLRCSSQGSSSEVLEKLVERTHRRWLDSAN